MAQYTIRRSKHATLVRSTVDTVKFSTKPKTVEVRNLDSTAVIFFRTDGTAPTVSGDSGVARLETALGFNRRPPPSHVERRLRLRFQARPPVQPHCR